MGGGTPEGGEGTGQKAPKKHSFYSTI